MKNCLSNLLSTKKLSKTIDNQMLVHVSTQTEYASLTRKTLNKTIRYIMKNDDIEQWNQRKQASKSKPTER